MNFVYNNFKFIKEKLFLLEIQVINKFMIYKIIIFILFDLYLLIKIK